MMIETGRLRKSFRSRRGTVNAVNGVRLAVGAGEIFGFLGPNGAGKTTTLRMLVTLIRPDGGTATVAGASLLREPREVRRRIGYVSQSGGTWGESTARQELVDQARLHGADRATARTRAAESIAAFHLDVFADRPCRTYSGGQRRRVDFALGVIHRPVLVFLDEPTTGLDPQSRVHLWNEVRRLRAQGMTVFLTTHHLEEADELCDRVAIIDHGEIVAEGSPARLKRDVAGETVTLGLNGATREAARLLADATFVEAIEVTGVGLRLRVGTGATAVPEIVRTLDGVGIAPGSIELHRPSLDDVFLAKTGRSLRDGPQDATGVRSR